MSDPLGLAVKTADSACDGTNEKGRLAIDSNQQLLLCQNIGGWKWKALTGYLKDPVANYASLPAAGNSSGDVRKTLDNQRHFTWNGASWIALAVDQNGNFAVPGALTVNGSKVVGDGGTNTWIQQSGKLNVTDSAGAYTDLQANDVTATGRTTSNDIKLNSVVTEGTACSPDGLVARDATGLLLSCQSSIWAKAQGNATLMSSNPEGGCSSDGGSYRRITVEYLGCSGPRSNYRETLLCNNGKINFRTYQVLNSCNN